VQGTIGGKDYAVALVNDQTYSYDCLNGLLRTVLIRSAPFARHNPNQLPNNDNNAWQDQGAKSVGSGCSRTGIVCRFGFGSTRGRVADSSEYVMDSAHQGSEAWSRAS